MKEKNTKCKEHKCSYCPLNRLDFDCCGESEDTLEEAFKKTKKHLEYILKLVSEDMEKEIENNIR